MPRRNLLIIFAMTLLSLISYHRASRNAYVSTLAEAMNVIQRDYVDEVDNRVLFEGAMNGMVEQLDPNSGYTPPVEYKQFLDQMEQEFGGIGIVVEFDETAQRLAVAGPLPGTPAFRAGVRAGDIIMALDGKDTAGLKLVDSTDLIRGKPGTFLKMVVLHPGETKPVELLVERAKIAVDSVLGDTRNPDGKWVFRLAEQPEIAYIRIQSFAERTSTELQAALRTLQENKEPPLKGLILDLRGNAGGLLTAAIETCDLFIKDGVIVSTRGRSGTLLQQFTATSSVTVDPDLPVVVLIDKKSASASEIVSACLQDHGRAKVVGQRSYGKGTVQNVLQLEGGRSALRLTIARYFRPSGKNIHKLQGALDTDDWGVQPDPGEELSLTNRESMRYLMVRNRRDILAYAGNKPSTSGEAVSAPMPMPPMPAEEAATPPATDSKKPESPAAKEDVGSDGKPAENDEAPPAREELSAEDKAAAVNGILFADPQLKKAVECVLRQVDPKKTIALP